MLVANEEGAVYTLVATYYNAMATGDEETTLRSVAMKSRTKTCIVIWNCLSTLIIIRLWRYIPRQDPKRVL